MPVHLMNGGAINMLQADAEAGSKRSQDGASTSAAAAVDVPTLTPISDPEVMLLETLMMQLVAASTRA